MSGFGAVSWRPWEQRSSCTGVALGGGNGGVLRATGPCGGGRSTRSRGGLQGAPVGGFVWGDAIISPVWSWAGGAGGVGTGRLAVGSLTSLATGFSLVVAVSCGDRLITHLLPSNQKGTGFHDLITLD